MNTVIKNALIINENQRYNADVLIKDGIIACIDKDCNTPIDHTKVVDGKGKILIPGIIDDHVHFREPGLTHKATIESESKAAICGGITSYMEMPNTKPITSTLEQIKIKQDIAQKNSFANYAFYLGATNDNFEEILKADISSVCGIKVFMGSSTGNMLVNNGETLKQIFEQKRLLVAVHCEDEAIIKQNTELYIQQYGDNIPISCHPLIRSAEACFKSSALAVDLAHKYGTKLHIMHVTTAKELDFFTTESIQNKLITGEACVNYLWYTDKDYEKYGTLIKCNPAIKTVQDQKSLRQAILDGKLDIIATDHAPHCLEEKQNPYTKAPSGGPSIQFSLLMMLELCKQGIFTPELIVNKMCHQPAQLFNVEKRGFIREGYAADLVLIDPNTQWTLTRDLIQSKCKWSPLEGEIFHNKITNVWVNGHLAYDNGIVSNQNHGVALRFG